jgi:Protein of unknown function (DUF1566)
MSIVKCRAEVALILLSVAAVITGAQSPPNNAQKALQDTRIPEYWTDPATELMWAGKDNGKDVTWDKSMKYCRELRLGGYSDWRLATLSELEGIYDTSANSPGLAGPGKGRPFTWHVKGGLFMTGNQWSSNQRMDDRGHLNGFAWRFDFNEGRSFDGDEISFYTNKRALCVRASSQ